MRKPAIILILLVLLTTVFSAQADAVYKNEATGYSVVIDDQAGLLSASEIPEVAESMKEITEYCNVVFYSSDGDSRTDVLAKGKKWGAAHFSHVPVTIFIIDMGTRRIGVVSSDEGGIHKAIDDGKANTITDNIYRYASREEYAECAKQAFSQMLAVLRGEKIAEPMRFASNILLAMLVAILLTYLLIAARMEQEEEVSVPKVVAVATAGAAAVITSKHLTRTVKHESSGGGGGHGGGFGGGGGGGFSGGGGSHGF